MKVTGKLPVWPRLRDKRGLPSIALRPGGSAHAYLGSVPASFSVVGRRCRRAVCPVVRDPRLGGTGRRRRRSARRGRSAGTIAWLFRAAAAESGLTPAGRADARPASLCPALKIADEQIAIPSAVAFGTRLVGTGEEGDDTAVVCIVGNDTAAVFAHPGGVNCYPGCLARPLSVVDEDIERSVSRSAPLRLQAEDVKVGPDASVGRDRGREALLLGSAPPGSRR